MMALSMCATPMRGVAFGGLPVQFGGEPAVLLPPGWMFQRPPQKGLGTLGQAVEISLLQRVGEQPNAECRQVPLTLSRREVVARHHEETTKQTGSLLLIALPTEEAKADLVNALEDPAPPSDLFSDFQFGVYVYVNREPEAGHDVANSPIVGYLREGYAFPEVDPEP